MKDTFDDFESDTTLDNYHSEAEAQPGRKDELCLGDKWSEYNLSEGKELDFEDD